MHTTEHVSGCGLVASRQSPAFRATGIAGMLSAVWRLYRNRRQIARLHDLDDRQLLDMGLKREDLHEALTSASFENPGSYLTRVAQPGKPLLQGSTPRLTSPWRIRPPRMRRRDMIRGLSPLRGSCREILTVRTAPSVPRRV